jgi:preprotein translocase subunit SecY
MVTALLPNFGKMTDLRRRLLFLLVALGVFRIGTHIPVPGIDPHAMAQLFDQQRGTILDMFNMFSGGALSRLSIFALGVMPYISASIILQLMSMIVPSLEQLRKEGGAAAGRHRLTRYTRYLTVVLAALQGIGVSLALQGQVSIGSSAVVIEPGISFILIATISLVTGTLFLMWLGEQVTERGVGNGISMLIFAGIVAGLPHAVGGTLELARTDGFCSIY